MSLSATSVQTLHSLVATVEQLLEAKREAFKGKGKDTVPNGATTDDVVMADGERSAFNEPESRRTVIECKNGLSLETLIESIVLGLLGDDPASSSVRSPSCLSASAPNAAEANAPRRPLCP